MLKGIDLKKIVEWLKTEPVGQGSRSHVVNDISTDSRTIKPQSLFVAIPGEYFDGHDYIESVIQKGAIAVLCEKLPENAEKKPCVFLKAPNSILAFAEIAKQIRGLFTGRLIAITGSAGKSSTKDMTGQLLGSNTLVSPKSFNNLLGVSKTICLLNEKTEKVVLEMGMNAKGEIAQMCEIFNPQGGAITNIGDAHIGKLGGREGIYQAKKELFDYLGSQGAPCGVALNQDDPLVMKASAALNPKTRQIKYSGIDPRADIFVSERKVCSKTGNLSFQLNISGQLNDSGRKMAVSLPHFGIHQAMNVAAAVALAKLLGVSDLEIEERLPLLKPSESRGVIKELSQGVTLIDESYNSNPSALLSALESVLLMAPERRKVLVLGEMKELESFSNSLHEEVGQKLSKNALHSMQNLVIIAVGALTQPLWKAIEESPQVTKAYFPSVDELNRNWQWFLQPKDLVLLKGSRGVGLEKTIPVLEAFLNSDTKK